MDILVPQCPTEPDLPFVIKFCTLLIFSRNEVWRYHPGFGHHWGRFRESMFRGFKWGLVLAVATVAVERAFGGGHGHGHNGNGHH